MAEGLANRLKDRRGELGLTQAELAERCGVTRKTVNTVENGVFVPSTVLAYGRHCDREARPKREAIQRRIIPVRAAPGLLRRRRRLAMTAEGWRRGPVSAVHHRALRRAAAPRTG